jgi:rubrerythrin
MDTTMDTTRVDAERIVDVLNSFLRGEQSAVETYRQALEKVSDAPYRTPLEECLRSHSERVRALTERILRLGGKPSQGSGPWGAFAKLVEGTAKVFGHKTAIAALEEGEDHGLRDYRQDIDNLDAETRAWFDANIFSEQERTHALISSLKHSLH